MNSVIKNYIAIARPDHWVKHIFIVPGIVLGYLLVGTDTGNLFFSLSLGLPSAFFIASGNYVINEWLDREFDKHHPIKKDRLAVTGLLKAKFVYLEYLILILLGLGFAWFVSLLFFFTAVLFFISGLIYNVPPIRFKEWAFLDVIVESINNPIRLTLGWSMVVAHILPPMSLLIIFWFGGAFLMTVKRLAEYRFIAKQGLLTDLFKYRNSFRIYTEQLLITSAFLYAILSSFFLAAFLIKYRNEFLFVFPFFALLFAYYLAIGLREGSFAQHPEKLHKDKGLIFVVLILIVSLALFSLIEVPIANLWITSQMAPVPIEISKP